MSPDLSRLFAWICVLSLFLSVGCVSTNRPTGPEFEDPAWTTADQALHEQWINEMEAATVSAEGIVPPPLAAGATADPTPQAEDADFLLRIVVFDIGQADSMLVVGPTNRTLLIDLGEPTQGSKLPPALASNSSAEHVRRRIEQITGRQEVDYFLLSHYHRDHAGWQGGPEENWGTGIVGLLSDFSTPFAVEHFIHPGDDSAEYMKPPAERGVYSTLRWKLPQWKQYDRVRSYSPPRFGPSQIDLGPKVQVDILAFAGRTPSGSAFDTAITSKADYNESPASENDLSIAVEITAGNFELFTAGDLTGSRNPDENPYWTKRVYQSRTETYTKVEHHLVEQWGAQPRRESDVEIYRANHHGSGHSSTQRLVDALDPEFIIYSTGADHHHPSNSVVRRGGRTARQLATTWVTDLSTFVANDGQRVGEIEIVVALDGKSYTIQGEKHLAFDDAGEAAGDDE